ncbi:MAG: glycosyltransferase family 9 protein [Candidatus Omnitrophica bacterium]|nr:glycosyltransferase family 9 protein [Candidatus Omnitrophota bacterium]
MKAVPLKNRSVRRILCVRSDRLGEFLLTLPALQLLKMNYPNAKISLIAQQQNLELVRGVPWIDHEIPVEMLPKSSWRLAQALRKYSFDMAVVFNPQKEFHRALFLAGIPLRVGYNQKNGFLLNHNRLHTQKFDHKHEIDQNIALAALVCSSLGVPSPDLPWNERGEIEALLQKALILDKAPFIVIHPFTSDVSKALPFAFWNKLIRHWTSQGRNLLIIGQASEYSDSEFSRICNPRVFSIAGKLTLRQVGALLKYYCRFYTGLDSGPYHMASMLGLPLAVIFRKPEMIPLWGPYFGKEKAKVVLSQEGCDKVTEQEVLRAFSDFAEVEGSTHQDDGSDEQYHS